MDEKIDILLATYNTKIQYLKEQIDSILNQTYTNFNLIISDDCSPNPEVMKILKEYEKKDNRITIYQPEHNLGYTQNFGFLLSKSTADYICFSDHDDIWYPQKLEKCIAKLKQENVDLVYCNCHQINENGEIIRNDYFKYKNMPLIQGHNKLAISRCIGIGCSQMFTKEIKEAMLPLKEQVMAHDWLVAFLANERKGITYINEPLFGYRLHESNVFGGRNLEQNLSRWKAEHGKNYKSYVKYREEKVIDKAYLDGAKMCFYYCQDKENKKFINQLITYYENLKKSHYVNFHWVQYYKALAGKNLGKKMLKEFIIFHLPILGYFVFYFN